MERLEVVERLAATHVRPAEPQQNLSRLRRSGVCSERLSVSQAHGAEWRSCPRCAASQQVRSLNAVSM